MHLDQSRATDLLSIRCAAIPAMTLCLVLLVGTFADARGEDALVFEQLRSKYTADVLPILRTYCLDCHSAVNREGELDLERFATMDHVRRDPNAWQRVAEMIDNGEMPPKDSDQPSPLFRQRLRKWVASYLDAEALAGAGDPGPVILRRLSNDEYNYTIHDLTGIASLDPTDEFPVDGAAGEGFTNSGAAQAMSPALLQKYLDAAKEIADHVVLLPEGIRFSPHLSRRDRTDELLARIQQFYRRFSDSTESVDVNMQGLRFESEQERGVLPISRYLEPLIRHRESLARGQMEIAEIATEHTLNEKYLRRLFNTLSGPNGAGSVFLNDLRSRFRDAQIDDVDALVNVIAAGQKALFKFNAIGHIGRQGSPASWMEPLEPITTNQRLELELPAEPNVPTSDDPNPAIRVFLSASDLGDGNDHDYVVFENPRIEFPETGIPPIALRDLAERTSQTERTIAKELPRTVEYLEAIRGVLVRSGNTGRDPFATDGSIALARDLNLNPRLLANWIDFLDLGLRRDREVHGHFTSKATRIHGYAAVNGWQGEESAGLTTNQSDEPITFLTLTVPPRSVVVHPSPRQEVGIVWRSPIRGKVRIEGRVADADDKCGNGATWRVERLTQTQHEQCAQGVIENGGTQRFQPSDVFDVEIGDTFSLVVGPRDANHVCDTTHLEWTIREVGREQRTWDLAPEIVDRVLEENPLADSYGNERTWHFVVLGERPENPSTVPEGSALARWRSSVIRMAAKDEIESELLAVKNVLNSPDPATLVEADRLLRHRILNWLGPLGWWQCGADGAVGHQIEPQTGSVLPPFGKHPRGSAVDMNDLCVQAPSVIEFDVPAQLAGNAKLVTTGALHEATGKEGSVLLQLSTSPPITDRIVYGNPFLVSGGSDAAARVRDSMDEFRDLFPAAICYMRIVPVDEVVTLTLFHREDDYLRDLMLDDVDARELDRLWDELIYVSREPLQKVVALEQLREFATQDRPDLVEAFAPLVDSVATRADQFRRRLSESEPAHLDAVLKLADMAWRRPLSNTEQKSLRSFYETLRSTEIPHEDAMRLTVSRVFASPTFLYRRETPSPGSQPTPVSGTELATRLSYFLWSSLPDAELRQTGDSEALGNDSTLLAQTHRMLADERTRRLAIQFACQWLHVRGFDKELEKNESLYPEFADLRDEMYEETVRFFEAMFRQDRSILELLDADHTFLNESLAKHYGIDGVDGSQWRRVDGIRDQGRGGVLAMATVLASQSGVSRTSPILRGNWVFETLLGERLPRPPPTVPQLPESVPSGLTARQLIEQHSSVPECATCHARIDPYGFALEQFDVIGRLRENAVDVKTKLPDGQSIEGLAGLRHYLMTSRRDDIVRQFCRKLLGYALGREVQISDHPLLDEMERKLAEREFRFSAAVEAIVTSRQFRDIRGELPNP